MNSDLKEIVRAGLFIIIGGSIGGFIGGFIACEIVKLAHIESNVIASAIGGILGLSCSGVGVAVGLYIHLRKP